MNTKLLAMASLLLLTLTISAKQPVEIKLHDAQKGIISMRNNFPKRDLGDCRITWMLLENGHKIEIVQVNNLTAEPNATAYLEFPYASKPFVYGGERWIRIEIRDKEKTQEEILAWAQFLLPEKTSPPPKPFKPELMPEISISESDTAIKLFNNIFSAAFSKKTGLLTNLKYYKDERLLQGPTLAMKPALSSLESKLVSITQRKTDDKKSVLVSTVIHHQQNETNTVIRHTANYHAYGDGTITISNSVDILDEDTRKNSTWVGFKTISPNIAHIDWYGSKPGAPVEMSKINTSDLSKTAEKSTDRISDLRWIGLTDKFCRGIFLSSNIKTLSAKVSLNEKQKTSCLLGQQIRIPAENIGPIEFSFRIHRYDTVLGFPDKLWHLDIPQE